VIGPTGGTVTAGGPGATTAVLRVPAGALSRPTTITVRPTSTFASPGVLSAVVRGVDLEPSGLRFATPATLDLTVPGGAGSQPLVAVLWEDDPAAGAAVPWRTGPGGTVQIDVPHFSGAGVGVPALLDCTPGSTLYPEAAPSLASIAALIDQLGAGADPAIVRASIRQHLITWHQVAVHPFVAPVDAIEELRDLVSRKVEWRAVLACVGLDTDPALTVVNDAGFDGIVDRGTFIADRYLMPNCNAVVPVIVDWVRVPFEVSSTLSLLGQELGNALTNALTNRPTNPPFHAPFCLRATVHEFDLPEYIAPEDRYVELEMALRLEVVAQGGDVTATPQRIDVSQFEFVATIEGATIDGVNQLNGLTNAVGRRTLVLDRGAEEEDRSPTLDIRIEAVRALPGAIPPGFDQGDATRASQVTIVRQLRPEPALDVEIHTIIGPDPVPAGTTVEVCARVRDEIGEFASGAEVAFSTDGPGSFGNPIATSIDNGVACVEFTSPDEVEESTPVVFRAIATRSEVTSPEATRMSGVVPGEDDDDTPPPPPPPPPAPVGGIAGILRSDSTAGGSTRAIRGGTQTVTNQTTSSLSVAISPSQMESLLTTGASPISVAGTYVRENIVRNDFGLPGRSERCVITFATIEGFLFFEGRARMGSDGVLEIRSGASGFSTRTVTTVGPEHPHCVRTGQPTEVVSTNPGSGEAAFSLSPVLDGTGKVTGYADEMGNFLPLG